VIVGVTVGVVVSVGVTVGDRVIVGVTVGVMEGVMANRAGRMLLPGPVRNLVPRCMNDRLRAKGMV